MAQGLEFECSVCHRKYWSLQEFSDHETKSGHYGLYHAITPKPFVCAACGAMYDHANELSKHHSELFHWGTVSPPNPEIDYKKQYEELVDSLSPTAREKNITHEDILLHAANLFNMRLRLSEILTHLDPADRRRNG
jgi:hypothetical protein